MYDPTTINTELCVQSGVNPGKAVTQQAFHYFVVHVPQFRVYLVMLGGQPRVSMIHTLGVYYSITSSTSAYQGKVLAFIGDWRAAKEPTPVCLPMTKLWDWHTGKAITDFTKCEELYAVEANRGTRWTPGAGDGAPEEISHHTTCWQQSTILSRIMGSLRAKVGSAFANGTWWRAKLALVETGRFSLTSAP